MTQGGSGARRSRRARRIVTRAATYITLLRTQRENIPLRDCVRSMAWKPCVQKDAVVCSMTASYDSRTRCPRPIRVARVYLVSSYARTHARTHTHTRRHQLKMRDERDGVDGATRPLSGRAHKHGRDGVGGPQQPLRRRCAAARTLLCLVPPARMSFRRGTRCRAPRARAVPLQRMNSARSSSDGSGRALSMRAGGTRS